MSLPTSSVPIQAPSRLTWRRQVLLSLLWFCLNFQSAAWLPIVIPLQIALFVTPGATGSAAQALFLGWLSALGAASALIFQPLVGVLSDRTTLAWGRRRPYIALGGVLLVVGTVGLGLAPDVVAFVAGFVVVQLASNIATAAYQGVIPDLVPPQQRGSASGYLGLMTILGSVGSFAIAALLLNGVNSANLGDIRLSSGIFYLLTAIIYAIGTVITLIGVRERPATYQRGHVLSLRQQWARAWLDPWRHANFTWVFFTRASVMMGITLFMTFVEYYFADVAHVANFVQATVTVVLLALVGAILSAFVLGVISDRTGRVPVVFFATGCMAAAALLFVLYPGQTPLWALGLLFGLGYGAYTSVDWALAIDSLPELRDAGKDLGIWSLASTLPGILAPLVGSLVIYGADALGQTRLGYLSVFALATVFLVLGAVFVLWIRVPRPTPVEARVES